MRPVHLERHKVGRVGWLRAAVLGANDGIVSTASLMIGVAAAASSQLDVLLAGAAGLAAGAFSMAAGEYVSVSSQADTEQAELARECRELAEFPDHELDELAGIYASRGVEPALAREVAQQLMQRDALSAHARDELAISEITAARPLQAALASAAAFSVGAAVPLGVGAAASGPSVVAILAAASLLCLATLGWLGAWVGAAPAGKPIVRVVFWGALAMLATGLVGRLFDTVVA